MGMMKYLRRRKESRPELVAETKGGSALVVEHQIAEEMRALVKRGKLLDTTRAVIAVSATTEGEGASFVSAALAVTLAHDTTRDICLVDLDWSEESDPDAGSIVKVASGESSLDSQVAPTSLDHLHTVGSSWIPLLERAAFANSPELRDALEELSNRFDIVILDIPSIGNSADAAAACSLADGTVLVVQQGGAPLEQVRRTLDDLGDANVLGVVMNRFRVRAPKWLIDPMVAG